MIFLPRSILPLEISSPEFSPHFFASANSSSSEKTFHAFLSNYAPIFLRLSNQKHPGAILIIIWYNGFQLHRPKRFTFSYFLWNNPFGFRGNIFTIACFLLRSEWNGESSIYKHNRSLGWRTSLTRPDRDVFQTLISQELIELNGSKFNHI